MVTVHCQLGFYKNLREGQILEVFVNGIKQDIKKSDGGHYLTPMSQRKNKSWYLKPLQCQEGDTILLRCKTGIRMLGPDERRTFDAIYTVGKTEPIEVNLTSVGFGKDFPILKGPLVQISFVTAEDLRLAKATGMLNDETPKT